MEAPANITLLGVLSLGMFVGFILGWTLISSTSLTIKIAASAISAALAGAPVIFMSGLAFEKWMYPIGLVVGLAWTRIFQARSLESQPRVPRHVRFYAWFDIIAIAVATLVVILCAMFVKVTK
jgi:hypothetical protein